jgi:hypothetical protein
MSEMFLDKLINKEFGNLTLNELRAIICNREVFSLNKTDTKVLERIVNKGKLEEDREKVVDLILDESVEIAENGLVTLPDEFKNLSDTGECLIVEFQDQSAIYFFEFRGILGESRGYVYVTDQIDWKDYVNEDKYIGTEDWIDIEEIETNWYSVKTE